MSAKSKLHELANKRNGGILLLVSILIFTMFYLSNYAKNPSDKPIVVIVPSYNNIKWHEKNLEMLTAQNKAYKNWRAIYIDDCSPDGTGDAVEKYIKEHNLENQIKLLKNKQRKGALENVYNAIYSCKNNEVVVICDGDDWFKDENVLSLINKTYQSKNIWMTYGQYEIYPSGKVGHCQQIPDMVIKQNEFRKYKWCSSHLRTFYAGLFKKIKKKDLQFQGKFLSAATDMAAMFPMLEMSGDHAKFIPEVLYVYNQDNPINVYKTRLKEQLWLDRVVRSRQKYDRVESIVS